MIPRRQIRARFLESESSFPPDSNDPSSFQVTMLRAFQLPPACRDVFVLKEIQGYTLPEVAATLGITKDDVRKHLRRARRKMQTS
jgi:RNA polymerase sigma factor (sigma-70 family)